MKIFFLIICISVSALAADEPTQRLITVNAEVAKAAFFSYKEGHYRFIQEGKLIEAFEVDEAKPSCILEGGHMTFDVEVNYALQSTRSLDDGEAGEVELNFETQSADPDSYFQMYCFQNTTGANLGTARAALKSVFKIE